MTERRVITSAEPFGFGPVSKLRAVGAMLRGRGWELDFVGAGSAMAYAAGERETFSRVAELQNPRDLERIRANDYDAAVSVMDPFLAVWAARNGLPCLYVDSLFWFWGWPDRKQLAQHFDDVMYADLAVADALESLQRLPMPVAEYIGHRAASVSCVQRTPSTAAVSEAMIDIAPVVLTGAIVDRSARPGTYRDTWVVSLSGLLNPLISAEEAVSWATTAVRLVGEAFEAAEMGWSQIHLTGNAEVIARMDHVPERFVFEPRDAGAVLDLFSRAHACLTPPGLTTMLESLAGGCPVIPLPPQHYGHERILRDFSNRDPKAFVQAATAAQLGLEATGDAAVDTRRLIGAFRSHADTRTDAWTSMVAGIAARLRSTVDSRAAILSRQRSAVEGFLGGFGGAREVVAVFEDSVGRAT